MAGLAAGSTRSRMTDP